MAGHTTRGEEKEILFLLEEAGADDLNTILDQVVLEDLFNDVDDHFWGPKNKTRLLDMLSRQRLPELKVSSRAGIVDGLQRGPTVLSEEEETDDGLRAGGIEERAIGNIFLGTHGAQLTELKNAVNAGADHYDMHQLLNHDVDDQGIVSDMLAHFRNEASDPGDRIKPLSDIDDTFYSSLKDERYPSGTVYPGVLAFYQELDRGPLEESPDPEGDLTFITARPEDRPGLIKDRAHRTLREHGVREAAVLAGSFTGLIDHERMAAKKFENFEQYAQVYPEYNFSWLGDSGQGDAILGQKMLEQYPDRVKGVFIHDVIGLPAERRAELQEQGIHVFDTYVGAALEAHRRGLISEPGLHRIAAAVQSELNEIEFDSPEQRAARQADLDADLARLP